MAHRLIDPQGITETSTQDEVLTVLGEEYVALMLGAHPFLPAFLAQHNFPLSPLPFRGAVYLRGTGENDRCTYDPPGWPRPASNSLLTEFGLTVFALDTLTGLAAWPRRAAKYALKGSREGFDQTARAQALARALKVPTPPHWSGS